MRKLRVAAKAIAPVGEGIRDETPRYMSFMKNRTISAEAFGPRGSV